MRQRFSEVVRSSSGATAAAALLAAPAGAAAVRLLFDLAFPRVIWLNSAIAAAVGALLAGALGGLLQRWRPAAGLRPFLPLLLSVVTLVAPGPNPVGGALLLGSALWLALLLALPDETPDRHHLGLLVLLLLPIYLLTMGRTVGAADTFEFQVTVPRLGIVHPTGYPLYLLLARLFVIIPAGPVAWRVNLASVAAGTAAALLLFVAVRRLTGRSLPGHVAAVALALAPTFWSQALVAEVYALHALFVAGALLLMERLLTPAPAAGTNRRLLRLLAWLGLGLANHLTTLFLLPPAGLLLLRTLWSRLRRAQPTSRRARARQGQLDAPLLGKMGLALGLPLLLYLYLPLRWPAVNSGEPMGAARFLDWVVGGRFQDALQWQAWLRDPARYGVVGRLFLDEWGGPALLIAAALGWVLFSRRRPWRGSLLGLIWLGTSFYTLNYYVPDLNVFLLPAQLVVAVCLGLLVGEIGRLLPAARGLPAALLLVLLFVRAPATWTRVDQSADDGLLAWGRAVLDQPLAENSLILADSEKIAPLYYLQQAEGIRPDLDIAVLFTEEEYRARLGAAIGSGQTVYLARFLPGLEGSFHLRSAGPLTEVGTLPLRTLPEGTLQPTDRRLPPLALVGLRVDSQSTYDPEATALTLYWQATEPVTETLLVYLRWADGQGRALPGQPPPAGRHPANDYYPTPAWDPGEIVPDFHLLPRPLLDQPATLIIQVALAPPFAAPDQLVWHDVTSLPIAPEQARLLARPLRQQIGPTLLDGVTAPPTARPGGELTLLLSGCGRPAALDLRLQPADAPLPDAPLILARDAGCGANEPFVVARTLPLTGSDGGPLATGRYAVVATAAAAARCGWLQRPASGCVVAEIEVSGVPLPAGAVNFEDRIALLEVDLADKRLVPGGELPVALRWQGLQRLEADYTVFLQVLDANDRIVGQVDSWPLQGTFPTSQWLPGAVVDDPYRIRLDGDLPPGDYRLIAGWYLLGTPLRRLQIVDAGGVPVDDKVTVAGLTVE